MRSQRPSAAFDPISPDLDLQRLVEETPNFKYVTRISCEMIEEQGSDSFDKLVLLHVILGGKPLVIEGFNYRLDEWTFTCQWLRDNCGQKFEQARNITKQQNMQLSIGHYLNNMSKLTDQWTKHNYKDPDRQRVYLKDIDCPQIWHDKLKEQIPPTIFYLNDSVGIYGGPGSVEALPGAEHTKGQGVARAGDMMSCLPPAMRAENMMCYIGYEGTYTPAHREMCASLGQNLMVETSGVRDEFGNATKPGSSIWFMTETNDRHVVSEYWLSTLGHDIEIENHFAQINAWKAAPFKTYIVDQRVGDFILIPPLAPHQVWNRGTRTMKVAWNRTTVETLEMALHEALPRARMVCRDEQYKNKAMIYFSLGKYSDLLNQLKTQKQSASPEARYELESSLKIRQLQKDFRRLFALYTEILLSEMLAPVSTVEKKGQYLPYDSFITCSFCRCNIFNRFLTCTSCVITLENGVEDTYDICMECYAMGRSCSCLAKYKWVEQFHWQDLIDKHEAWRLQIIDFAGGVQGSSERSLQMERKRLGKKTLAQVCQEQLKERPWNDPKKPAAPLTWQQKRQPWKSNDANSEDKEIQVDDDGNIKKSNSKKTRAEKLPKGWAMEHVSCYPEQSWKVAPCSRCDRFYSYGALFRMFDLMPLSVMENPEWECPACLRICSCGACVRRSEWRPYEPTGTVLGHDTRKVADPRSVESLVNFSHGNLPWIKKAGDDHPYETRRLSRRKDEAERAKAKDPELDEDYIDDNEHARVDSQSMDPRLSNSGIVYNIEPDIPIDPMLSMEHDYIGINSSRNGFDGNDDYAQSSKQAGGGGSHWDSSHLVTGDEGLPPSEDTRRQDNLRDLHEQPVAPMADMVGQDHPNQNFTTNGISYEYPDPTIPHLYPSHTPSEMMPLRPDRSEMGNIENSNNVPLQNDGTQEGQLTHLTQLEQMLENARANDRYYRTEASITGKTLRVKLSISRARLAAVMDRINSRPPDLLNGTKKRQEAPILLQSDYPPTLQQEKPTASKKRKLRKENDSEFSTRKRTERKSLNATAKETRKLPVKYVEIDSNSEHEEINSFTSTKKAVAPRPLPRYLAQRSKDGTAPSNDDTPSRKSSQPGIPDLMNVETPQKHTLKAQPREHTTYPAERSADVAEEPILASTAPNEQGLDQSINVLDSAAENKNQEAVQESSTIQGSKRPASRSPPSVDDLYPAPPSNEKVGRRPRGRPPKKQKQEPASATISASNPNIKGTRSPHRPVSSPTKVPNPESDPAPAPKTTTSTGARLPTDSPPLVTPLQSVPDKSMNGSLLAKDSHIAKPSPRSQTDKRPKISKPSEKTPPVNLAQKRAEENRKAKLKALQWAEDEDDDQDSDSASTSSDVKPIPASKISKANVKPAAPPRSILALQRINGKKIKIVSARNNKVGEKAISEAVGIAKRSLDAL